MSFRNAIVGMRRSDVTILYELLSNHPDWIKGNGVFNPATKIKDGKPMHVFMDIDGNLREQEFTEGEFEKSIRLISNSRPVFIGMKQYRFMAGAEAAQVLIEIRKGSATVEEALDFIRRRQ